MKVLIVSGSPRIGGNSDVLCDHFLMEATLEGMRGDTACLPGAG